MKHCIGSLKTPSTKILFPASRMNNVLPKSKEKMKDMNIQWPNIINIYLQIILIKNPTDRKKIPFPNVWSSVQLRTWPAVGLPHSGMDRWSDYHLNYVASLGPGSTSDNGCISNTRAIMLINHWSQGNINKMTLNYHKMTRMQ